MEASNCLSILTQTIATHARKLAHEEWDQEYRSVLSQLVENAGLSDTLSVDGREIPIESIIKAIREAFLASRAKILF